MAFPRAMIAACLVALLGVPSFAAETEAKAPSDALTFESDIYPILREHCLDCHGAVEEKKGGLDLRLVRFMIEGGDSGQAISPGEPAFSYLMMRIKSGEMPPGDAQLAAEEIETIERWIAAGAPTARPEPEKIGPGLRILPEERAWWSFQPIERPEIPDFPASARVRTPIDTLLLAAMPAGLAFSPDADKRTLMLRVYLDLTGLPPTSEEMRRFLSDESPDAYENLVDRLLDSPHYGERWARHWLDIAGYADSEGRTSKDAPREWAYKYRDYVIRSLNEDKPFDQFIHEQLAGDELAGPIKGDLTPRQIELLTATGFLRMAADGTGSGDNSADARNQVMADTIKIVSSSLLGLTVACAQCHDHRYDPISHVDYHAMRAIFEPALDWKAWKTPAQRNVSLYTAADRKKAAAIEADVAKVAAEKAKKQKQYIEEELKKELAKHEEPLRSELRAAYETPAKDRSDAQKALLKKYPSVNITPGVLYQYNQKAADDLATYDAKIQKMRAKKPPEEFIRALVEPANHVPETKLFHRGDYRQPKQTVAPAALTVLSAEDDFQSFPIDDPDLPTTGRRLALAKWLTSDKNPIFARVLVNRVWMHHFGRGIVATPADFGKLGAKPTHPKLLDWLASEFMAQGWSLKELHRLIVTSTAYRQSSHRNLEMAEIDGGNRYYWRQFVTRLDAELVRDRWLVASGQLDRSLYGPPIPIVADDAGQVVVAPGKHRRSLYIQQRRSQPVALLQAFDAPVMMTNCGRRPTSTVATQSLMLMNGAFVLEQALALAARAEAEPPMTAVSRELTAGLPSLAPPLTPLWQFGYGGVDEAAGRTSRFTPLPHFDGETWQGGPKRPDPKLGWVLLTAAGGHPGNNPEFAAIRRWIAPAAGLVRITGTLSHASDNGDGVRGRILSSRSGLAGDWTAQHGETATATGEIFVEAGDTIDFVADCRGGETSDGFGWTVEIALTMADGQTLNYSSNEGFHGPAAAGSPLQFSAIIRAWELAYCRPPSRAEMELAVKFINEQLRTMRLQPASPPGNISPSRQALANLCQALLTSNELLYIE